MALMAPAPLKHQIKGAVFAAQACSCIHDPAASCTGDPCTCGDPCPCDGADLYLGPRWRFVGDHIEVGTIEGVDVSQRTFLNLAQTPHEQSYDWHEMIFIDDEATPEQVRVLLDLFGERQGSALTAPAGPARSTPPGFPGADALPGHARAVDAVCHLFTGTQPPGARQNPAAHAALDL